MPKGYWIAAITIRNAAAYTEYQAAMRVALEAYGGRYLVRGGQIAITEGRPRPRAVVIEFDDLATAVACYESPEMAPVKAMRQRLAESDLVVVEGWDGAY
jgi:uncharacterized protein (DUF1330 family)